MKYSEIMGSSVGHVIDLSNATDEDKDRFVTAFEMQKAELYERLVTALIEKTGHEPEVDAVFDHIADRAKNNYFEPDELDQIAYAAGFTGITK